MALKELLELLAAAFAVIAGLYATIEFVKKHRGLKLFWGGAAVCLLGVVVLLCLKFDVVRFKEADPSSNKGPEGQADDGQRENKQGKGAEKKQVSSVTEKRRGKEDKAPGKDTGKPPEEKHAGETKKVSPVKPETTGASAVKPASTQVVVLMPKRAPRGDGFILRVRVEVKAPGTGTPQGAVTFFVDGAEVRPNSPLEDGMAEAAEAVDLEKGRHVITARFQPSDDSPHFLASKSEPLEFEVK
jgi:hypothetical protein